MTAPSPAAPPGPAPGTSAGSGSRRRIAGIGGLLVLAGVVVVLGLVRTGPPKVVQGGAAPVFAQPLIGGGTLSSASLAGKPVVFNFFASWCTPCIEEAPTLEGLFKQYQQQGVQVIGVDYEDPGTNGQDFIDQHHLTYPVLSDPDGTLATAFGVRGVPETFFVDRRYRFASVSGTKSIGALKRTVAVAGIQALLKS